MRSVSLLHSFDGRRRPKRPRTVTVTRQTLLAASASLVLLTGWAGATLYYFVSRDDLALVFLERQAVLKRSYEERIAALTSQIEGGVTERKANQQVLETRLSELLKRQEAFEKRQETVQRIASRAGLDVPDLAGEGSASNVEIIFPPSAQAAEPQPPKPEIPFELRLRRSEPSRPDRTSDSGSLDDGLARAAVNLKNFEIRQIAFMNTLVQDSEAEVSQIHRAIRSAGLDPNRVAGLPSVNSGGPFVPVSQGSGLFETMASQAEASIDRLASLRRVVAALPFGEPIQGELDLSSTFGYRLDPFTRTPALHTGLDFKAEYGAPARATGAGRVVSAEYSGAYGNMVEVDHGHGVTSRYAHLSSIVVLVGQDVQAGSVLGRVGSTGRSTGPHLHYETRISGDAVNPIKFLKAGAQMTPLTIASR